MSAMSDRNASVCGGLAAALLDACGGEPDTAREWLDMAHAPSWGQVASALEDLRNAREHLEHLITAATPCEQCGAAAGIGCAWDCLGTAATVFPERLTGVACSCGRDALGDLGEPAEHGDGCPIWERARAEVAASEPLPVEHWSGSAWSATAPHGSDCPCGEVTP